MSRLKTRLKEITSIEENIIWSLEELYANFSSSSEDQKLAFFGAASILFSIIHDSRCEDIDKLLEVIERFVSQEMTHQQDRDLQYFAKKAKITLLEQRVERASGQAGGKKAIKPLCSWNNAV